MATPIRVFAFSPAFGLPTPGPFALKLLAVLRLLGVEHAVVHEDDTRKGPKRKNPWIEDDGQRIGDTELILEHLRVTRGVDLDAGLDAGQAAIGHALRRTIEEHLHQALEWEMFVDDGGWAHTRELFARLPWPVRPLARLSTRRHLAHHLWERGLARHTPQEIAWKAGRDVAAIHTLLEHRPWLVADRPTVTDATAFGMLAPMVYGPLPGPVASAARASSPIVAFCGRMRERTGL